VFYLIGISILCYIGNNPDGHNLISFENAIITTAIFSLLIFVYGAYISYDREILPNTASNDGNIRDNATVHGVH
jgi:hypothetical protein